MRMVASSELVLSFGQFLKKIGKKDATVQSYCRDLRQFFNFLNENKASLSSVNHQTLLHYRTAMQARNDGGKSNSFRRAVIAIRQFYRMLPQFSGLPLDALDSIPIPNREEIAPRKLKLEDVERLLQGSSNSVSLKEARDRAIVSLFCFEGIKVSELIQLEWKHFLSPQSTASLLIPGERKRVISLNSRTHMNLNAYQKAVQDNQASLPKNYKMFLGFKGRDFPIISSKVSRHGLKFMLYELGESCGVSGLNTEILRHYAIQHHLDSGANPEDIMKHFGLRRIGNISKHRVKKQYESRV
uniref:Uncharacterized protein n=1 Tax=uncultured bacterium Ak20-3 TaxID=798570 RepID=D9MX61_9BACT|nr:hypothetical protein AKSOIL_0330 [uncultured bacterium Ak20-3]